MKGWGDNPNPLNILISPMKSTSWSVFAQRGVSSIEYALVAALIAIAVLGGLSDTGAANRDAWITWTKKIVDVFG